MNSIKIKKLFLLFSIFLISLFSLNSSSADYIHPSQLFVKTSYYRPQNKHFALGEYEYNVKWQGILVGSSKVIVKQEPNNNYIVTATAKSAKVISVFYSLNHLSQTIFAGTNLNPISFYSTQTENSKTKSREVSFNRDGKIEAKLWKNDKKGIKLEEEVNFLSTNTTFDPISAAFLARSLAISGNEEVAVDVFNGKHRFLVTLKVAGKETIKVAGIKKEAYKVIPTVKKLTDTEGEKRLQSATIWVSTDKQHDVLKLESKVLVGSIGAELIKFTPQDSNLPVQDPTVRTGLKQ